MHSIKDVQNMSPAEQDKLKQEAIKGLATTIAVQVGIKLALIVAVRLVQKKLKSKNAAKFNSNL